MEPIKRAVTQIVLDVNPKVVLRDDADYTRPLKEIGIDSLDTMSILLSVQERFQIEIPDADVDGLKTLSDVLAYVAKAMEPGR